jgi:hypothetical protein
MGSVYCCFHNFHLRHDGWMEDAPQVDADDEVEVDSDYELDKERETKDRVEKWRRITEEFIFYFDEIETFH